MQKWLLMNDCKLVSLAWEEKLWPKEEGKEKEEEEEEEGKEEEDPRFAGTRRRR